MILSSFLKNHRSVYTLIDWMHIREGSQDPSPAILNLQSRHMGIALPS
jgi:hypothetical protein